MAKTSPDYERLKKTLRAFLLSSKNGCTPRSLVEDYKLVYKEPIPFKELGFKTLMELLHDMRDAVAVHYRPEGTRLYGIADKSTKHIADMVASQKDSKKRKGYGIPSSHPSMSMITKRSASWGASPVPKAPLTFHAQLKTLFLSYPNGIALPDFAEAFARRFGYYFSYKGWGFSTLEQVLGSIPEVVTMETDLFKERKIVRLTKPPAGKRDGVRKPSVESLDNQKQEKTESVEVPQPESLNSLEVSPQKKSTSRLKQILATREPPKRRKLTVPKKVVDQVETILRAFPTGIWLSRFPNEFKKYFDEDLPVSALGFSSVLHLLTSTPVCEVERPTGLGDWLAFRRGGLRPKVADNHQFLHEAYVSDDLVRAIHRFMKLYPKGIPLTDFTTKFEEQMKHELPVEEFGFNSVTELLQRVRGVDVSKPPESKRIMVFSTSPLCESETESSDSDRMSAKERDAKLTDVSSQNKPRSVYARQPWPLKDNKQVKVYVTYVKTPSCFCIQLIGDTTTKPLEALQEDMTAFFNSKDGDGYSIKEPYIGQACCSIFNNDGYWYRSEILSIPTFDTVEIHYVDYGNSSQVPLTAIRRPKAHYLTLPAQSISCRLANLKPAGSTWGRMATELFRNMTNDKPLVAVITAIQDNCMSVCLCDTNKKEVDIHINDCLRNQGMAIFDPDTEEDQRDYDGYQLEPSTLQSWNKEDVRSPGHIGTIASASLNTAAQQNEPAKKSQTSSLSSTSSRPPSSLSTSTPLQGISTSSNQPPPLLSSTQPAYSLQNPSTQAAMAPLSSSLHPPPPPPSATSLPSFFPNVAAAPANLAVNPSSSYLGGGVGGGGGFQASPNPQLAQLQMQNYRLQQLLLIQQLSGGGLPMLGLQGIVNPLLAGGQAPPTAAVPTAAGQNGFATGQNGFGTGQNGFGTGQNGFGTGQNGFATGQNGGLGASQATSFPPGFAPPGLAQNAPPPPPPVVNSTFDIGQGNPSIPPASASVAGSGELVSSSQQVSATSASGDDVSLYGQAAADSVTPAQTQTPPTSVTSSTHLVENSTHSAAATTTTSRVTRRPESSSISFSSRSEESSSLSSEEEPLQSSRKLNHVTGATTNADSSESEGGHGTKKLNNGGGGGGGGGVINGGAVTECLFYNGGARSPAWAKEKAFIKRVHLTDDYSISIIRHDDKAYFLSSEVSEWFWESDLLQSMLRQVDKPCWGLIMMERKNKKLFQTLRRVSFTSRFVLGRQQIMIYSLEDLPQIVRTFHGPVDLCTAVRDQVEVWQMLGLAYFTAVSEDELQALENTLADLKKKRKHLVELMMEEDDAEEGGAGGGVDSALTQLIEVKRKIIEVNRQLCKLKKLALISKMASSSEPASLKPAQQWTSSEPSGAPISEGAASSSNGVVRVGEVKGQGGSNFTVPASEVKGHPTLPPPDAAKNVVNSVDSECHNSAIKSDDLLESPLCLNASLLPDSGITDVESVDVNNIRENTAEVDPLLGDIPDAAAEGEPGYKAKEEEGEDEEDSVFIDEGDDKQATTPVLTIAARTPCVMTKWKDGGSGEKDQEEAPIVIPSSSKSYSSVASSPPTTNSSLNPSSPPFHPRQQQPQQPPQSLYPPRYFRASSLPPPPSTSTDKPPPASNTQNPTTCGQERRYPHQRPPSPAVYSTRPQSSEFIPIPGSSGGAASYPLPMEQEWPTLHDSQQQPRRVRTHNVTNAAGVSSNQNPSPDVASKPPSTSVLGSPPMSGPAAILGSPPLPSMRRSSSSSAPNFSNPLLPAPTTAQSILPPRFANMRQGGAAAVTSQSIVHTQGAAPKRRPAGIGRGGRPLPPLDNSMLAGGGGIGGIGRGVPPVRPIIVHSGVCGGRPPIPPHLYMDPPVNAPPGMRGRPLLPSPLRPSVVVPPPVTSPIPVSPEERWIYMSRRGRPRSKYDYPPLGSSAGLDII